MNIKIKMFLMTLGVISAIGSLSSCSKIRTEVNGFVTSIDNYTESISRANSTDELFTLDRQFAIDIEKYLNSKAELTDADRDAIMEAIVRLAKENNKKSAELSGTPVALSDSLLKARADDFRQALDNCKTLGDAISMGL